MKEKENWNKQTNKQTNKLTEWELQLDLDQCQCEVHMRCPFSAVLASKLLKPPKKFLGGYHNNSFNTLPSLVLFYFVFIDFEWPQAIQIGTVTSWLNFLKLQTTISVLAFLKTV
jgi:hypothetical protein